MKIDFIRHGKTQDGAVAGRVNAPLMQEGVEQAQKVFLEIAANYEALYSSDSLKCKQTAEILNQKLRLSIQYDSRLKERDFGSLAGKALSEMDTTGEIKEKDKNQQYDYRPFGGESVADVQKRVFSFIKDVQSNSKDKKILVVTSGGIIRLFYYVLKGEIRETVPNCSVHTFEFS